MCFSKIGYIFMNSPVIPNLLIQNLRTLMQRNHINARNLAEKTQLKPSFIYDILNGKSANPSATKLALIANTLNSSLTELMGLNDTAGIPPALPDKHPENAPPHPTVTISRILTSTPTADGKSTIEESEGVPYYFRRSWVQERLQTQPENLRMVFVHDDTMTPTLCPQDMVLVDITKKHPSPSGVFVLFDGFGLIIKRLELLSHTNPPMIRLISDNPQYPAYEISASHAQIIGRMVWFAREI
jgi:phage repressor protein C with HTH and peptisase S24 domain